MTGDVAAIICNDFYSDVNRKKLVTQLSNGACFNSYISRNVAISYFGCAAIELKHDKAAYLNKASEALAELDKIVEAAQVPHPVNLVIDLFGKAWPKGAQVAREISNNRSYFAGIIRSIRSGPLHTDISHRDFPQWFIGSLKHQLSWNIYLQVANGSNGALRVWKRMWDPSCEALKSSDNMVGYGHEIVKGYPYWEHRPSAGQLVIFNPYHFHEILVNEAPESRLSISSFMGLKDLNSPWFFWS